MPNSTPRLQLAQPVGTDAVAELRESITANATTLDTAAQYGSGTFTNRSSAATTHGNLYEATDVTALAYYSAAAAAWQTLLQLNSVHANANTNAQNGQLIEVTTAGVTINLPTAVAGGIVAVWNASGTAGSPTTVSDGGSAIFGAGMTGGVTSWLMGSYGQCCIFTPNYLGSWICVSGQYDTGWLAMTVGAGVTASTTFRARQVGATVHLGGSGVVSASVTTGATLLTLPAGIATPATNWVTFPSAATAGRLLIASGSSAIAAPTGGAFNLFFDGLQYPTD